MQPTGHRANMTVNQHQHDSETSTNNKAAACLELRQTGTQATSRAHQCRKPSHVTRVFAAVHPQA